MHTTDSILVMQQPITNLKSMVTFRDNTLAFSTDCTKEYQYGVADLQGKIVCKGKFLKEYKLCVADLPVGHYEVTVFNDEKIWKYPIRIR